MIIKIRMVNFFQYFGFHTNTIMWQRWIIHPNYVQFFFSSETILLEIALCHSYLRLLSKWIQHMNINAYQKPNSEFFSIL